MSSSMQEEFITFTVVQAPRHGAIERTHNGQNYQQTSTFTMDDIYQNRVSYNHDGSNSLRDRFTFTITDGSNLFFLVEEEGKEVSVPVRGGVRLTGVKILSAPHRLEGFWISNI